MKIFDGLMVVFSLSGALLLSACASPDGPATAAVQERSYTTGSNLPRRDSDANSGVKKVGAESVRDAMGAQQPATRGN